MERAAGRRSYAWGALVAALVMVGLAGCGGSSGDGSGTSTATDATGSDTTGSDATGSDDAGGGDSAGATFWSRGVEYDAADGSVVRSIEGLDDWPYFEGYTAKTEAATKDA
jgi:hypothetical protein